MEPEYLAARRTYYDAKKALLEIEARIADVQTWPNRALSEARLIEIQPELEQARSVVESTYAAYESFKAKPAKTNHAVGRPTRFNSTFQALVSISREMGDAIADHCQTQGIGKAELIRRALASYLKLDVKP